MSPNTLKQIGDYNGSNRGYCGYDHEQIERLISATEANGAKIDGLTNQYNQIIKWLLIVVCVIALGAKLVEMAKDLWGHNVTLKSAPQ